VVEPLRRERRDARANDDGRRTHVDRDDRCVFDLATLEQCDAILLGVYSVGVNASVLTQYVQGGTMCVAALPRREPIQSSDVAALPTSDSSGAYSFDFNA